MEELKIKEPINLADQITGGDWSSIDRLIYRRDYKELYNYGGKIAGDKPVATVMGLGFYPNEELESNAKAISQLPKALGVIDMLHQRLTAKLEKEGSLLMGEKFELDACVEIRKAIL